MSRNLRSGWKLLIAMVLILATALSCGAGAGPPPVAPGDSVFHNPLFAGASLITVGNPKANCHTTATPTFTWQATGERMVFAGLFRSNISESDGRIVNTIDNIWAWHSGLGRAREGNVNFADGVTVANDSLILDKPPVPLEQGRSYTWAVWAWNADGSKIVASSEEVFFTVDTTAAVCR
ncbi:MAG: hypothetical protein JWM41_2029 [Gemmatimonadetes bacterium]|nr:hypothetical protein [Gemmatimonadota bacterium]